MTYKDFKGTLEYNEASLLDLYDADTLLQYDDDFPEEDLEKMQVVGVEWYGTWLHLTLKKEMI